MESAIKAIAGPLEGLWRETKGSPEILVAVLDGPVDLAHQAFDGASLTRLPTLASGSSRGIKADHGTHVASVIFGQHNGPVKGIAPACKGLIVPVFSDEAERSLSQLDLARAINQAVEAGAHVINVSGGQLAESGEADPVLEDALDLCRKENRLVVAAAGNDGCACLHVPAALPSTIAVGAIGRNGKPLESSNWGDTYKFQGVLAPGEGVLGAKTGGGVTQWSGSSFATPIVTGVAALLMSIQKLRGETPDPGAIRNAILQSALPCPTPESEDCRRYLKGVLNIRGVHALISRHAGDTDMSEAIENPQNREQKFPFQSDDVSAASDIHDTVATPTEAVLDQSGSSDDLPPEPTLPETYASVQIAAEVPKGGSAMSSKASGIVPANEGACGCSEGDLGPVFFIGELNYDFGTEARRDSFKQLMPYPEVPGAKKDEKIRIPPNPYDHRQMVDYLNSDPEESTQLIWTANLDLQPIYAIKPEGAYAERVYEFLRTALGNQVKEEDDKGQLSQEYIERISVGGQLTGETVRLYSGQVVPVVRPKFRMMYGWQTNALLSAVIAAVTADCEEKDKAEKSEKGTRLIRNFLDRIYYDLRSLGTSARDRAINYSATNAFQAASELIEEASKNYVLMDISAEKSPFCRMYSECWDVKLRFFNPSNVLEAKDVIRLTIDVSDPSPVTVGDTRVWQEA